LFAVATINTFRGALISSDVIHVPIAILSPEQMVKGLLPLLKTGANVVGSCCGSTPEHIRAFRKVMDEFLASEGIEVNGGLHESRNL